MLKKLFTVVLFAVLFSSVVFAQSSEKTNSFNSEITIDKSGVILIIERISYDFGSAQRHGITRAITFVKTNDAGERFKLNFQDIKATDEKNKTYPVSTSTEGDKLKVIIGDPNVTVTGAKNYVVSYKVSGAITYFSDYDELYWNITGNDTTVPTTTSSSVITLPGNTE